MRHRYAFSLVELSIVLVILGLLVGGVLAGQSLIRASELRSISAEQERHKTAFQAFKDKYFAVAGDMSNAEQFWGTLDAVSATCRATEATAAATCNGNGNGSIESSTTRSSEMFRVWQHLANAGLIEGRFTGAQGAAGGYDAVIGSNTPASKFPRAGWSTVGPLMHAQGGYYASVFQPRPTGHYLIFGSYSLNGLTWGGVLKPEEAWNVDTKLDDGKPATGSVTTVTNTYNSGCASSDASTADYRLTVTTSNCALHMVVGL